MKQTVESLRLDQAATYQIKIQGRLAAGWSGWFDDLALQTEHPAAGPTITILTGLIQDQAALHGLLNRIRDLSLPLLSVQLIDPAIIKKE